LLKFFISIFAVFFSIKIQCQVLDKSFYLVDGLSKEKITDYDKTILDTALKYFHSAKHDTSRIRHLSAIVENCMDDKVWMKYNDLLLNLSRNKKINAKGRERFIYESQEAMAINNIGYYFQNHTNYTDSALYYYQKSLEINLSINSWDNLAVSYSNIANIYQNRGEYAKAIELYNKVIEIEHETTVKTGLFSALNNIANIYLYLGDTAKTYNNLLKCFDLSIRYKNENIKGNILHNLGMLKVRQKQSNQAIQAIKTSLSIRKKINDTKGIASSLTALANIMIALDDAVSAELYLKEAEPLLKELNNPIQQAIYYRSLGDLQSHLQNNLSEGIKNYKKALSLQEESKNYGELIESISGILPAVKSDPAFNQLKLELIEKLYEYGKIVDKEAAKKNLLQAQYEKDLNQKEIEFKIEEELKDQKRKNEKRIQQYISISIGFVLILVSIFSLFIFKALKLNKQNTAVIQHQKLQVEHQNELLAEKQKEIIDSINYAKRIQDAYLPPEKAFNLLFEDSFIVFKPKDIVSGDFYWFFCPRNKNNAFEDFIFFAVADCTGHGVPGAIMSVICCNALNDVVVSNKVYETDKILNEVRTIVKRNLKNNNESSQNDGMDISLCKLHKKTLELSFSGANNPLVIISNNELSEVKADKQPVGNYAHEQDFSKTHIQLKKGDMLYLFSDGYSDQFGGHKGEGFGKKLKYANFKKLLLTQHKNTNTEQKNALLNHFNSWKGDLEQTDDVCVMGVRV
jgi:serine phosphatase RsbU (regulator of sigma subunit)/tetratricopeptide (TPR) repeat protein